MRTPRLHSSCTPEKPQSKRERERERKNLPTLRLTPIRHSLCISHQKHLNSLAPTFSNWNNCVRSHKSQDALHIYVLPTAAAASASALTLRLHMRVLAQTVRRRSFTKFPEPTFKVGPPPLQQKATAVMFLEAFPPLTPFPIYTAKAKLFIAVCFSLFAHNRPHHHHQIVVVGSSSG